MAIIKGKIAFGVHVAMKLPLAPDKVTANKLLKAGEKIITSTLEKALMGVIKIFPGVLEVACTGGATQIEIESVE